MRRFGVKQVVALAAVAVMAVVLASVLSGVEYLLLVAAAAAIHEAGHIIAAKLLRVPSCGGGGAFFGLSLRYDFSGVSYLKEAAVSSSGAAANILTCVIVFAIVKNYGTYSVFFVFSNLSLALFNLIPVSPLDGSGILRALLSIVMSARLADRVSSWISSLFGFSFFVFCIVVQLKVGANLSLMFIAVFLLYNSMNELRSIRQ